MTEKRFSKLDLVTLAYVVVCMAAMALADAYSISTAFTVCLGVLALSMIAIVLSVRHKDRKLAYASLCVIGIWFYLFHDAFPYFLDYFVKSYM
jgi:hypothetical protein